MKKITNFTEGVEGEIMFENESVVAVRSNNLDEKILVGSYVIIPKSGAQTPFDLSEKEWTDTIEMLHIVKKYIDETYKPDGYNLGWNIGEVAGQSVLHAHFHILPRYKDELYAGKGIRSWLKQKENVRERDK